MSGARSPAGTGLGFLARMVRRSRRHRLGGIRLPLLLLVAVAVWLLSGCSISELFQGGESARVDDQLPTDRGIEADSGFEVAVERVIDGDSVEAIIDGELIDIRVEGYNAPELYGSALDAGRDELTCNGQAAKAALAELLAGGPVRVVGDETDRFGRRLSDLIVDGRSVGREMVARGWGLAVGEDLLNREAMKQAAADGLGMWGQGCGVAAAEGLSIGDHQVNPAGSDRDNLDQEWVTIVNRSERAVDLLGWVIRDDTTGHRFELVGVLGSQQALVVRSGRGTSTAEDYFLDENFPVWSNSNETVLLVDPSGVVAAWAFID